MLTAKENISDFREVTAAEKSTLEAADAKWIAPSEDFIAQCSAAGVVYNRTTGYFELNGLVDITEKEMRVIMNAGSRQSSTLQFAYINLPIRTHLLRVGEGQAAYAGSTFYNCSQLEIVEMRNLRLLGDVFTNCSNLRSIGAERPLYDINSQARSNFTGCKKLVTLKGLIRSNYDINLADCPLLSHESIEYMVEHSTNSSPITITLHPEAYARLTDELIASAADKQITFATT